MAELTQLVGWLAPALRGRTAYLGMADGLRGLILEGRLPIGDRLPAERRLAAGLGTSRTTVTSALTILRAEGYLASRPGSDTVVTIPSGVVDRPGEPGGRSGPLPDIDLTIAALPAPSQLGPLALEAAAALPSALAGHGLHPLGLRDLRLAVAGRLTRRGLRTTVDQILITQGALHGWDLLLRTLARPGDRVAVEQPTYPAVIDAATARGARIQPLPVDSNGWALSGRSQPGPLLAHVTPDFQNPTGLYAGGRQRRELLRDLRASRVVVDETFVELGFGDGLADASPLASLSPQVVTVGSLSKVVWAGMRVGWLRAEPELVARLATARAGQDFATPVLDQLLALAVFAQLDEIRAERVRPLAGRRDHLIVELARAGWPVHPPSGGLVVWADLGPMSSTQLASAAWREGVRLTPGTRFSLAGTHDRFLRIPFCYPEPVLTEAVNRLIRARATHMPPYGPTREPRLSAWTA